jgi:hypothetical protein
MSPVGTRTALSGVQSAMLLGLGSFLLFVCLRLPAPMIPPSNLAGQIESADTIIVARLSVAQS